MKFIENKTFDEERALYGESDIHAANVRIDGKADGESAFKECKNVLAENCYFNLRYPLWHCDNLQVKNCEMTENCRAALWYSRGIIISDSKIHGIKALRECADVEISHCNIISPEFGWSVDGVRMLDCTAESEYFMMRSKNLVFENVKFSGKYSFQYIENSVFENCEFDTKDAFWHVKNVTVKNCTVKGEYLAWYCENVTFENCKIIGTQPLCWCRGLKLVNCEMHDADLAFEKSDVEAVVTTPIISVKNPYSGYIKAPEIGELIRTDERAKAVVETENKGIL